MQAYAICQNITAKQVPYWECLQVQLYRFRALFVTDYLLNYRQHTYLLPYHRISPQIFVATEFTLQVAYLSIRLRKIRFYKGFHNIFPRFPH